MNEQTAAKSSNPNAENYPNVILALTLLALTSFSPWFSFHCSSPSVLPSCQHLPGFLLTQGNIFLLQTIFIIALHRNAFWCDDRFSNQLTCRMKSVNDNPWGMRTWKISTLTRKMYILFMYSSVNWENIAEDGVWVKVGKSSYTMS